MDGMNGLSGAYGAAASAGEDDFWGLPVAFAMDERVKEKITGMTDEEREVLRAKSGQVTSDAEMNELVRMISEGKFE